MKKIVSKLISISLVVMMFISVVGCSTSTTEETEVDWDNITREEIEKFYSNTLNSSSLMVWEKKKPRNRDVINEVYSLKNNNDYYLALCTEYTEDEEIYFTKGLKEYSFRVERRGENYLNDFNDYESYEISSGLTYGSGEHSTAISETDVSQEYIIDYEPDFMGHLETYGSLPPKYEIKEDGKNHIITYEQETDSMSMEGTITVNENLCVIADENKMVETFSDGGTWNETSERKYTMLNEVAINYEEEAKKLKEYAGKDESKLKDLYNEWKEYTENLDK